MEASPCGLPGSSDGFFRWSCKTSCGRRARDREAMPRLSVVIRVKVCQGCIMF